MVSVDVSLGAASALSSEPASASSSGGAPVSASAAGSEAQPPPPEAESAQESDDSDDERIPEGVVTVQVHSIHGKVCDVQVRYSDCKPEIDAAVREAAKWEGPMTTLSFGRRLDPAYTVHDYGWSSGDTIHVVAIQ